jgi:hypothetical protein
VVRRVSLLATTVLWPILQQRDYPVVPPLSARCQGVLKPRRVVSGPSEAALRAAASNDTIPGSSAHSCKTPVYPFQDAFRDICRAEDPWDTQNSRLGHPLREVGREGTCANSGGRRFVALSPAPFGSTLRLRDGFVVTALGIFVNASCYDDNQFDRKRRCRPSEDWQDAVVFPRRHTARPFGSAWFLIQVHIPKPLSKGAPIPSMSGYCVSALESQSWKVVARVTGEGSPFPATGLMDGPNLYVPVNLSTR